MGEKRLGRVLQEGKKLRQAPYTLGKVLWVPRLSFGVFKYFPLSVPMCCPPPAPKGSEPGRGHLSLCFCPAQPRGSPVPLLGARKVPLDGLRGGATGGMVPDSSLADSIIVVGVVFSLFLLLLWTQLTTNIIPGSKKVIKPNSGLSRARPTAAFTMLPLLMLKLAL